MKTLYPVIVTFLIFPVTGFAQTGPAGVLTSSNNVFWLKADTGACTDAGTVAATNGENVQQWNDRSGNEKNFTQSTSSLRPVLTANSLNGFPAITFDGTNDYLANISIASANTADFFAVIKYTSSISGNPGIFQGSAKSELLTNSYGRKSVGMWVNSSDQPWGRGVQSNGTQRDISRVNSISSDAGQILENRYGSSAINQYINSTASGSASTNGTLRSWTEFAIGSQGSEYWNGDIAEVIAFNTSLNLAQRTIINNYLSAKYDITISDANDYYSGDATLNGNYDFEVAGIGNESDGSSEEFSPSTSGGLGIKYVSGFNTGEYILAGHQLKTGNEAISTDVGGMTGPSNQRWKRIWYIDVTGSLITDVNFDMSDGGLPAIVPANPSNYVLLTRAGTSGNWTETSYSASITGDVISFSNVSLSDGYYTIGTRNDHLSPIPVKLISFTAQKTGDHTVELRWQTASENNNSFFAIEYSNDGNSWKQIGSVEGNGSVNDMSVYIYVDNTAVAGINYYRLRQAGFDGHFSLSPIRVINMQIANDKRLAVFPNPARDKIFIKGGFEIVSEITIYDVTGKSFRNLIKRNASDSQLLQINIVALPTGIYFIRAQGRTISFFKD